LFENSKFVRTDRPTTSGAGRRLMLIAACVTILAAAALGSTGAATARGSATKPTLTYNGNAGDAGVDHYYVTPTLVHPSRNSTNLNAVTPDLAASWKIFPGNKSIQFTLRPGVRFSDGTPLTAQAVKTFLEWTVTDPFYAFNNSVLGPIASIRVVSKLVVRITLKTPNPNLLYAFAFVGEGPISPKAVAALKANPNSTILTQQSYGAGPYMLDAADSVFGDHVAFVPNPYYYDKSRQPWGKIVVRGLADPNAALAALQSGQVVMTSGNPSTAEAAASSGFSIATVGAVPFYGVAFLDRGGHLQPALADVRVRQALNHAVDRKTITSALFGLKYATPTSEAFYGEDGYDPKLLNYYPYDPAKAKALLAAAGYAKGFTLKLVGFGPWLDFVHGQAMGQAICKYFAAVNVTCDIDETPGYAQYASEIAGTSGAFPAGIVPCACSGIFNDYKQFLTTNPVETTHGWIDPVSNRLWQRAIRAKVSVAAQIAKQLNARWTKLAYFVPVLSYKNLVYFNPKRVHGVSSTLNWAGFWYRDADVSEWKPVSH
jgi:peptide/nickel transport system substrate-binding protein